MAIKSHAQRKAFFARLADTASTIQQKYHTFKKERQKKHEQQLETETKLLAREEKELRAHLARQQARDAERSTVDKLKRQIAQAKQLKFEQSFAGRVVEGAKRAGEAGFKLAKKQL
jgi:hypothetical protein